MIALWVNTRPFVIGTSFDMLLILLFPTGRPLARWWWLAWWLVVAGTVVQLVAEALLPGPLAPLAPFMNPFGLAGAVELLQRANDLGTALLLAGARATLLSLLLL